MILSTSFIGLQFCQDKRCQRSIPYRTTQQAQQKKSDSCADITNEHLLSPKLPQNIPESITESLALAFFRQRVLFLRRGNDRTKCDQTDKEPYLFYGRVFSTSLQMFHFREATETDPRRSGRSGDATTVHIITKTEGRFGIVIKRRF
jgi:hypothetical protein